MPRAHVTEKDIDFIKGIRSEVDENLVRQELLFYKINMERSTVDNVYGEITSKVYNDPVSFYARCLWLEPEQTFQGAMSDTIYKMEVYCDVDQLERRGIVVKAGDIIERSDDKHTHTGEFFEIDSAVKTQPMMGHIDEKIEMKLMVRSCRFDFFNAPGHPISPAKDKYSGTMNPSIPSVEQYGTQEIVWPSGD